MPSVVEEAKRRFQQIQEAYEVLSDGRKRTMYDAGLYNPQEEEEEDEGFYDFVQEMLSLMAVVRERVVFHGIRKPTPESKTWPHEASFSFYGSPHNVASLFCPFLKPMETEAVEKSYSLPELQNMLFEMAQQSYDPPTSNSWAESSASRTSKRARQDTNDGPVGRTRVGMAAAASVHVSNFDVFGSPFF
ncbi:hypothetical protein ACLOJK_002001 [Asimina triloba]